jgi:hypothetical protein
MTIAVASVTTTPSAVFTSSGNTAITFLSLCNYSNVDITTNLYVVPNGSLADFTTIVYSSLLIPASDTYQVYVGNEKLLLQNGDTIQVDASAGSSVNSVTSYTAI